MIQDIAEIYHNEYGDLDPGAGEYIMFVNGRSVLMKKNTEEIEYLRYEELEETDMTFRYLFSIDNKEGKKRFFLGEKEVLRESPERGRTWISYPSGMATFKPVGTIAVAIGSIVISTAARTSIPASPCLA